MRRGKARRGKTIQRFASFTYVASSRLCTRTSVSAAIVRRGNLLKAPMTLLYYPILYIDIDWYELGNASSFSINSTIPFSNYLVMAFFSILVYSSFSVIYQLLCNILPPWVLGSFPSPLFRHSHSHQLLIL